MRLFNFDINWRTDFLVFRRFGKRFRNSYSMWEVCARRVELMLTVRWSENEIS